MQSTDNTQARPLQRIGLVLGPAAGLLLYFLLPEQYLDEAGVETVLGEDARWAAVVGLWMAIWWLSEAIPVYATALLPLACFPLAGVLSIKQAASSYGHELIFLFLGGFIVALAIERWGLHRRIALTALKPVGANPRMIVAAFMCIAAGMSMWVTNTATTIMLLPVALSVIRLLPDSGRSDFAVCLLLGIAYAASIGGVGTIIGTGPNLFVVSFIKEQLGRSISFVRWMQFGVPLVLVFVPCVWLVLTRIVFPLSSEAVDGTEEALLAARKDLPSVSKAEKMTLLVFVCTALAWVTRPVLNQLSVAGHMPLGGLTDSGIAVIAALVLFVTPVNLARREFLMNWETAQTLPWGLLILFGGGLCLAAGLDSSGFSGFLGSRAAVFAGLPSWVIIMLVTAIMIFLTELTSNVATTATLVPVLYAVAIGLKMDPLLLILPAGIAASCAFMLPVATPPNAIVYGSGEVELPQMSRAGLLLNMLGVVIITLLTYAIIIPVLGIL
ncbi:MAG: SLC13 family permease [Gammaproteobacteria bacterium]